MKQPLALLLALLIALPASAAYERPRLDPTSSNITGATSTRAVRVFVPGDWAWGQGTRHGSDGAEMLRRVPAVTAICTYDGRRRCATSLAHPVRVAIYAYDDGRVLLLGAPCRTGARGPGAAYDANGNTLSETQSAALGGGVTTYGWDKDNRLRAVTAPSGVSSFDYDANGLRTRRVEGGVETRYLLDGASVLEEFDGAGAVKTAFLNNPQAIDDVLAMNISGQVVYPLADALGSVYALTDGAGVVVRRQDFDVYGERTSSTGAGPATDRGFTAREHDAFGKRYHRDRFVAPSVGAWIQPDRLGLIDGPNLYVYVGANPTMYRDSDGFFLGPYPPVAPTRAPVMDTWSATVVYRPLTAIAILVALGAVSGVIEQLFYKFVTQCEDDDDDSVETFWRGDSLSRARKSVRDGFIAAGIGQHWGQRGFGLYMTRQPRLAEFYAQERADQYGQGAVLQITINTKVWELIKTLPGVADNVMMNSVWLETYVPTGTALDFFDAMSWKVIVKKYQATP